MPCVIPVIKPLETVALALLIPHDPPAAESIKVILAPTHTLLAPVMCPASGKGFTVIVVVVVHPVGNVYVIIVVPAEMPATTPAVNPTIAMLVLSLFQVPLPPSLKVVFEPAQTIVGPVIAEGKGLTDTTVATLQPVGSTYVIPAVPVDTPVTIPVVRPIVAFVLLLLHEPPAMLSLKTVVKPMQTLGAPDIADGNGLTVIITESDLR
jgi:hypothetical protein